MSAKQSKNKLTFKEFVTALCIGAVLKVCSVMWCVRRCVAVLLVARWCSGFMLC